MLSRGFHRDDDNDYASNSKRCKGEDNEIEQVNICEERHVRPSKTTQILFQQSPIKMKKIESENLVLEYGILFQPAIARTLFAALEEEIEYLAADLTRVKVFGKWHNIPRKQAAYGDDGMSYSYSGNTSSARAWTHNLEAIRDQILKTTGIYFNFVLINRYKDGQDKIGEHKDDEKELDRTAPIASVSFGQSRCFYFVHQDSRRKKKKIDKVSLNLENGSLLLMHPPTNKFWYHALPVRASATGVRINLTFRRIVTK